MVKEPGESVEASTGADSGRNVRRKVESALRCFTVSDILLAADARLLCEKHKESERPPFRRAEETRHTSIEMLVLWHH